MNVLKKIWPLAFQGKTLADLMASIALQGALFLLAWWIAGWMYEPWIAWLGTIIRILDCGYLSAGILFAVFYKTNILR